MPVHFTTCQTHNPQQRENNGYLHIIVSPPHLRREILVRMYSVYCQSEYGSATWLLRQSCTALLALEVVICFRPWSSGFQWPGFVDLS